MATDTTSPTTPACNAFINSLTSMVNTEDTTAVLCAQVSMLSRFEKTNEMLSKFNKLSSERYENTGEQFRDHTQVLMDMKKDLDVVFRKIRMLKDRLSAEYPVAFEAASRLIPRLDEEDEEDTIGTSDGRQAEVLKSEDDPILPKETESTDEALTETTPPQQTLTQLPEETD